VFIWLLSGKPLYRYLSKNSPLTNADILIVEGWLSDNELEFAAKTFREGHYKYLVTIGVRPADYFPMGMNGDLIFSVKGYKFNKGSHTLSVDSYSSLLKGESGKFEVLINDQQIGETYTSNIPSKYKFSFSTDNIIDSVIVRFVNDAMIGNQSIDLYISSVEIDSIPFPVNDTINKYVMRSGSKLHTNILGETYAIKAKQALLNIGIPGDKIIDISCFTTSGSRTYQTAQNTIHILDSLLNTDNYKINIVSIAPHTRRTYMAYKRFHPANNSVGIIAVNSQKGCITIKRSVLLKELAGIIFVQLR
jgi:hypothetical protein